MPVARTYLPLSPTDLQALADDRELAAGAVGVAVGPGGGEEAEYAAWLAAAELAGDRVAGAMAGGSLAGGDGQTGRDRRVIASADVDLARLEPAVGVQPSAVTVSGSVPLKRIVSFHVDESVGSGIEDLLWFDVSELDEVLALVHDTRR